MGKSFSQENDFKYSINGFVEIDHFSFFKEKRDFINHRNQSLLQLNIKSDFNDNFSFFSSVEFRNDLSDSRRDRIYLKEAFIDMFFPKIDLRIGKQVILWGKADGFNPTNNLIPTDYSDILDTDGEEIGILSANAKFYVNDWQIQGIFSPAFQASVFPSFNSRWQQNYPSLLSYNGLNLPTHFLWNNTEMHGNVFSDSQFAFKVSRNLKNLDFSFSYYNGLNDIPLIYNKIESVINDTINISITQNYYKHQVIGIDFSYILEKYVIKGEGAFFIPNSPKEAKTYFQYALGFDRAFNNIIYDKSLFVIVQWIQELKVKNLEYSSKDLNHLFQKNIMSRIEMELNRNMKLSLQLVYALKYEDFYIKPEFKYNISDGLNLNLSTDILGGNKSKEGFFSSYSDNTRVQIKLKYNF
ncbi:MAG: hypothetical protein LBT25_11065 [Candidatus Symbiothrix sp.]|nr:hypothetical protein [Candidatus Symbiothrix sp.]